MPKALPKITVNEICCLSGQNPGYVLNSQSKSFVLLVRRTVNVSWCKHSRFRNVIVIECDGKLYIVVDFVIERYREIIYQGVSKKGDPTLACHWALTISECM